MESKKTIPKIIHYCWFGKKEKPTIVKKCIASWKDKLIDYEIKEWNEDNFDLNSNDFVREAYKQGKYAFVSDYVRVYALYNYGGVYLDTDVEVSKEFSEEILSNESFWGFEQGDYIATSTIGTRIGNKLIGELLQEYTNKDFDVKNLETNVKIVSEIIKKYGVKLDGKYQNIQGILTIYPQEYFSPYDYINCYSKENQNTYTIHRYYKSWLPASDRLKSFVKKSIAKAIGGKNVEKFRELITKG